MYKFGNSSQKQLESCHIDIQTILNELIKVYDFSIIEGHRSKETQVHYYMLGLTELDGENDKSKHQSYPSMAVDIIPYAKNHNAFSGNEFDNRRFYYMMGLVKAISNQLFKEGKITHLVRFGLDWDSDDLYDDQKFHDLPHMELIKPDLFTNL